VSETFASENMRETIRQSGLRRPLQVEMNRAQVSMVCELLETNGPAIQEVFSEKNPWTGFIGRIVRIDRSAAASRRASGTRQPGLRSPAGGE
jgi:hypothetical protein